MNRNIALAVLCCSLICPFAHGDTKGPPDILDPKYYDISDSVPDYLLQIKEILSKGVGQIDIHADDLKKQLHELEKKQKAAHQLSIENKYQIIVVEAEQRINKKRLSLLEDRGAEQSEINVSFMEGLQNSVELIESRRQEQAAQNKLLKKEVKDSLKQDGLSTIWNIITGIIGTVFFAIVGKAIIRKTNIRLAWGRNGTQKNTKMRD